MDPSSNIAAERTSFSQRLFRALCQLAGADYQRIATCPLGDKQFAGRIGLQLAMSSLFLFTIFASSLMIGFGGDLVSNGVVLLMAFVTAAVILLVDIQIVQSDFHQHGLELARDRGLEDGNFVWAKIKRPATVILRLALSVTIAFAFATFFELRLFGSDITRQIETDYRAANTALFRDVEASYDARLKRLENDVAREDTLLRAFGLQEAELRGKLITTSDIDPEISSLVQKLMRLAAAKEAADSEALRRTGDAVNEIFGVRETAEQSGNPGDGRLHKAANARAALARQESNRLAQEIANAQTQIVGLRDRRTRELERANAEIGNTILKLNREVGAARARRFAAAQIYERAVTDRESAVLAIAQARPEYAPKTDGFLARVEALETLKKRPAVFAIALWTTLVIMAIEISAVLSKVFFSAPTTYAVRTALEFEHAVVELLKRVRRPVQDAESESIRKDIEIEELQAEFLKKRSARLTKEAALREMYPHGPSSNRSVS